MTVTGHCDCADVSAGEVTVTCTGQ
jgi:hypothetical protein